MALAAQRRAGDNSVCIGALTMQCTVPTGLLQHVCVLEIRLILDSHSGIPMSKHHDEPSNQSCAAKRALAEAGARRKKENKNPAQKEFGGPRGAEPTRYNDWERKGIASDF